MQHERLTKSYTLPARVPRNEQRRRGTQSLLGLWELSAVHHLVFRGFPGGDSSGEFGEVCDAVLIEDADGDGGAVASGAVYSKTAITGDFVDALLQVVERDVDAAWNVFRVPLTRVANVDD